MTLILEFTSLKNFENSYEKSLISYLISKNWISTKTASNNLNNSIKNALFIIDQYNKVIVWVV